MIEPRSDEPVAHDTVFINPPEDGIDVLTYLVDDDKIGLALSIRDERLGEFCIPLTGPHAAGLHYTLGKLLTLAPEQAAQIVRDLKAQQP